MIPTKELRRGNLVINQGKVVTIEQIYRTAISFIDDHGNNTIAAVVSDQPESAGIDPIPISPEWLERCGFEQHGKVYEIIASAIDLGLTQLLIDFENGVVAVCIFNQDHDYGGSQHVNISHCKHIHQLQNLYFAMTGNELTVTP